MWRLALALHRDLDFDVVHCRSYLPALVGLHLKRRLGVRFLFDMRGFWADERVDGHVWNLNNPAMRAVFNFFKRREADFLREADHVISLTETGREILIARRDGGMGPPITVIPCCVDFSAFPPVDARKKARARQDLKIPSDAAVVAYVGSFGSWYMISEMLDFFRVQLERDPSALFLIVSREPVAEIRAAAEARGVPADRIIVRAASRDEVPNLMAAADYGLFFIQPVFSKKASSPTKMGELLSLELPIVANAGVGDVEATMADTGAGVVVREFSPDAYRRALEELVVLRPDMDKWRRASRCWFDLQNGIDRYDAIYRKTAGSRAT
jgi:glycosyltransferase involved in cell wall biosynthesis